MELRGAICTECSGLAEYLISGGRLDGQVLCSEHGIQAFRENPTIGLKCLPGRKEAEDARLQEQKRKFAEAHPWTPETEEKLNKWLRRWNKYTGENWTIESRRHYAKVTIISNKGNRALVGFRKGGGRNNWSALDVRREGVWWMGWNRKSDRRIPR